MKSKVIQGVAGMEKKTIAFDFLKMGDEEKQIKALEFFSNLALRYDEYDKKGIELIRQINSNLTNKDDFDELQDLMSSVELKRVLIVDNNVAFFNKLYMAAIKEKVSNNPITIYNMDSIDEVAELIEVLNMYFWRIEFEWEEAYYTGITEIIEAYSVSYISLAELIYYGKYARPLYIGKQISKLYKENGKELEGIKLISLLESYCEGEGNNG